MGFYLGSNLIDDLNMIIPRDFVTENLFLQRQLSIFSYDISEVGSYAFYGCNSLTSVNFPQVTSIRQYAFYYCSSLTSISFPQATLIAAYAFYHCDALTSVSFPKATRINSSAFYGCSSLASISFPQVTSVGAYAFYNCNALISVNFPKTSEVGSYAFYGCGNLASIKFPSATYIRAYAFYNCNSLSSISLAQASYIYSNAFASCDALTSITLPRVLRISSRAFYECYSLNTVTCAKLTSIEGSCSLRVVGSKSHTSLYGGFAFCRSLQTISVPLLSYIGPTAFAYCSYLTSFIGPKVLTVDGSYIVSSSKANATIYRHSLYGGAFASCYRLSIVSLPQVTEINRYAFVNCYNLLSLYLLGSSIPSLVATAFRSTPISNYTTSTGGVYGSIFVPASLYSDYLVASGWSVYSARIVSV